MVEKTHKPKKFAVDRAAAEAALYAHDHELLRKGIRDDEVGVTYILTTSDPSENGRMCKIGFTNRVPTKSQSEYSALAKFVDWNEHYETRSEAEHAAALHRGSEYARVWALPFKLDVMVAVQFTPYASGLEQKLHAALRRRRWRMMREDCASASLARELHGDNGGVGAAWKTSPAGPLEIFNYSPAHAAELMSDLSPEAQVLRIISEEAARLEGQYKRYEAASHFIDGFRQSYCYYEGQRRTVRNVGDLDRWARKFLKRMDMIKDQELCFKHGLNLGRKYRLEDEGWEEFMGVLYARWSEAFRIASDCGEPRLCGGDVHPAPTAHNAERYIRMIINVADRFGVRAEDGSVTTNRQTR